MRVLIMLKSFSSDQWEWSHFYQIEAHNTVINGVLMLLLETNRAIVNIKLLAKFDYNTIKTRQSKGRLYPRRCYFRTFCFSLNLTGTLNLTKSVHLYTTGQEWERRKYKLCDR